MTFDLRNPLQTLTKVWLAISPAWIWTLLDLRLIECDPSGSIMPFSLYALHRGRTCFHNAAFSVQVCVPFFISVQVKPFEFGRYFQAYLGWRPGSGWLGAKLRLTSWAAEEKYNPGVARGWFKGWS